MANLENGKTGYFPNLAEMRFRKKKRSYALHNKSSSSVFAIFLNRTGKIKKEKLFQ
jgi:hypothetical protein